MRTNILLCLFFTCVLTGCWTKWTLFGGKSDKQAEGIEPTAVVRNTAKDDKIKQQQAVASESASALKAVSPAVDNLIARGVVDVTADRLSAVSQPSVESVEKWRKIIAEGNTKALEAERNAVATLKDEISKTDKKIKELEQELNDAEAVADLYERKAARIQKDKTLWMFTCIGALMFVAGAATAAFSPFKKSGLSFSAGGLVGVGFGWLVDNSWFAPVAGGFAGLTALMLLSALGRWLWLKYFAPKTDATPDAGA